MKVLILLCVSLLAAVALGDLDPVEQAVLKSFAKRAGATNLGWDTSISLCGQNGITCSSDGEHVVALSLPNQNIKGTIPSSLFQLSQLTFLDLSQNFLRGTIPTEIAALPLTEINFSNNLLRGTIPPLMAHMNSLIVLNLGSNTLACTIPTELGDFVSLNTLDLRNNQLYGTIPDTLFQVNSLSILILSGNDLVGSIPSTFSVASFLSILNLDNNKLSSTIPAEIGQLFFLTALRLNNNQLYGRLPDVFSSMFSLSILHIEDNHLSGPLPYFFSLSELYVFGTNTFCPISYDTSTSASNYDTPSYPAADCPVCSPTTCWTGTCVPLTAEEYTCDCSGTTLTGDYCDQGTPTCSLVCRNGGKCTRGDQCDCGGYLASGRPYCFAGSVCTNATRCYRDATNAGVFETSFPPDYRVGTCPPGFIGQPYRQCKMDGTWGPIYEPCVASSSCGGITEKNAVWPTAVGGTTVSGTCVQGFHGNPTRACQLDGTWDGVYYPCQRNRCGATSDGVTQWPDTPATANVYGTCLPGFTGRPKRLCDIDGNFGPIQGTPCS